MNQTLRRGLLLVALLATATAFDSLDEDDLACEEIAVTISECCPAVSPEQFQCDFDDGCGTPTTLTRREIECLESMECDAMQREGVCEYLAHAPEEPPAEEEAPRCLD